MVMCNAGGEVLEGMMGASGVWAPLRGCLGQCGAGEEVRVVEVDMGVLNVRTNKL